MLLVAALLSSSLASGVAVPIDDEVTLRAELAAQLRLDAVPIEGGVDLSPRLSRLRPMLHLETASGDVRGFVQGQVGARQVELLDAFFDGRASGSWRLRGGLMKVPFTQYRSRAWFSLPLSDWALTARAFGAERQIGVQASGPVGGFGLTAGVFGGQNERASHAIKLADLYGEPVASRLVLGGPVSTDPRLHPEVFVQLRRATDGLDLREGRERTGSGPWQAAAVLSLAADARPEIGRDLLGRGAIEGIVQGHGLGLVAAGIGSLARAEDRVLPGLVGGLTEGSLRVGSRFELGGRAAVVHAPAALRAHASAARIARGDGDGSAPWATQTELAPAWNTFLPDPSRAITVEATRRGVAGDSSKGGELLVRAQLHALF